MKANSEGQTSTNPNTNEPEVTTAQTLVQMWDSFVQAQRDVQAAFLEASYHALNARRGGKNSALNKFKEKTDQVAILGVQLLNHLGNHEGLRDWLEYRDSQHLLDSAEETDDVV